MTIMIPTSSELMVDMAIVAILALIMAPVSIKALIRLLLILIMIITETVLIYNYYNKKGF